MSVELELLQFRFSHYNEKVRWALDYKGLAHRRTDLLPGPHARRIRRLTGQTQTPVLRIGSEYVHDSTQIIERLERMFPEAPALLPADETDRDKARELTRHFDLVVGPAARICAFAGMLDDADYVARMFATGQPWLPRTLYRAALPLLKGRIRAGNGMTDKHALREAERFVATNMDSIAQVTYRQRYLVGDAFSVADLTAAALLAPLLDPPHPDMQKPTPLPPKLAELTQRWRDHPGGRWALAIYERHRGVVSRS